ncbi:MAG: hypothetical protein JNM39_12440 [Bdellovibrionaceae bacterium]|nr:hypothetical protein [Pseudobdellovibrionaceae bacterium]
MDLEEAKLMNFRFLSLILIIFFGQMGMTFAKKTVCSITINSDDDIRLFKEHLWVFSA